MISKERLRELMAEDTKRHPVIIDANNEIGDLCEATGFMFNVYGVNSHEAAQFLRTVAESLFYLGYQAGKDHIDLDEEIWE
jgi:hypothetical protein